MVLLLLLPFFVVSLCPIIICEDEYREGVDDEDEEDEFVVEILIPVRRNLSCFCVSSFTE
ncbi:hypothetical protein MtrunA17_Chr1g0155821 [Medicago truncatula]|uniref:Transmembrane protein n=1 Tax=Medicago truncatula TaxID=3880 RepID=A0A396JMN8_MEDTR|nr:hypothetical protein MtrunA17_Chr1g0155821 [Medicago truncatula]